MTWFYVDDGFWSHPKTLGISLAAVGVWTLAGSWCAQHLTDGYIPADALIMVCGKRVTRQCDELVERNLWTPTFDGWQFVDWLDWQSSKADIEAKRAATKERMRRWRNKDETRHKRVSDASRDATPYPSQPSPSNAPVGQRVTRGADPTPCEHGSTPALCALCRHRQDNP